MDPYTEVWFPDLVSCPLGGLFSLFLQLSLWRRANARNVSFFTLYGDQFTFSTQLLTLNDLLYSCTYFSDVIKMMDVFSILQEATSDDNLCRMITLDGLLFSDEKKKICEQETFVNHGNEEAFFFQRADLSMRYQNPNICLRYC